MVKLDSIMALAIVGAFLYFGGSSLVPKAIDEAKQLKSDVSEKSKAISEKRAAQRGSSG